MGKETLRYQLVLQFHASSMFDFDELIVLEDLLIENLPSTSEIDGHDFGAHECNIFILTDHPHETFEACNKLIQRYHPQPGLKAAYRSTNEDGFVVLWPPNLLHFQIT